jgi:SDR family mycofactocin-dependent oxidoreductase
MERFRDKVALVTGAARGQGRSHAITLAQQGADIVAVDICGPVGTAQYGMATPDDLRTTAKEVEALDRRVLAVECDVRSSDGLRSIVAQATAEIGPIDVVVANAGIWALAPFWELTDEQWDEMLGINLTGIFRTLRAVVPGMMERRRGSIVITSSVNGLEAGAGFAHYTAAKHGAIGLMRNVALELGPYNIRCNAVLPGIVDSAMNDWQGVYDMMAGHPGGTPEDRRVSAYGWSALAGRGLLATKAISQAVSWLASDEASEVTGVALPVDGGHLILPGINTAPVIPESGVDR